MTINLPGLFFAKSGKTKLALVLGVLFWALAAKGEEPRLSINFEHLEVSGTGIENHSNPVRGDLNYRLATFGQWGDMHSFLSLQTEHHQFNGRTGVLMESSFRPRGGLSRLDGGPFRIVSMRLSGRPSFSGTFYFRGYRGTTEVYQMSHVAEKQETFTILFDDAIILTEMRWEVWNSTPQFDEIVVVDVDQPPENPSLQLDFSNLNFLAVVGGPFPV